MSSENTYSRLKPLISDARRFLQSASKPVFWLGAGCSIHDGVPAADNLVRQYLQDSGDENGWGSLQYRFDRRLKLFASDPNDRLNALSPYFRHTLKADSPYRDLVSLMAAGCADLICTFNIDSLLDEAFIAEGLKLGQDYAVINPLGGDIGSDRDIRDQVETNRPRIKLLKLHGDVLTGVNFMTSEEISEYGQNFSKVFGQLSERPAVVCGYSFVHLNVLTAFSKRAAAPVYYVNPEFPVVPAVLSLMTLRSCGNANFIDGKMGRFGEVMARLRGDILGGA
jgi:hypothetical protein